MALLGGPSLGELGNSYVLGCISPGGPLMGGSGWGSCVPVLLDAAGGVLQGCPDLVRFQETWNQEHTYLDKLKVSENHSSPDANPSLL